MSRHRARRPNLSLDALEGRHLQSGFAATAQAAGAASLLLPYIEQENLRQPTAPNPRTGEGSQIIAILIG